MEQALRAHLGDRLTWTSPKGGFFVWATLPEGHSDMALLERALARGLVFVVGSAFFVDGRGHETIRLSFSAPSIERIGEGVRRLASAFDA
jgi:DNA-binding transcriptional MocR family regulator